MPIASGSGQYQQQSLTVLSIGEIRSIGTADLEDGDVAVLSANGADDPTFYGLHKGDISADDGSTVLYTHESKLGTLAGRWIAVHIGAL